MPRKRVRTAWRPTTSTTMQLALGDCLAVALLEHKGFTAHDFKMFHPGGSLGAALKFVADVMHTGEQLPLVDENTPMSAALVTMTQKSFGCLGVIDGKGKLAGVITDGDLRRHMGADLLTARTADIMTRKPKVRRAGHARIGRAGSARTRRASRRCSWWTRASPSASCTCTTCCARAWPEHSTRLTPAGRRKAGCG